MRGPGLQCPFLVSVGLRSGQVLPGFAGLVHVGIVILKQEKVKHKMFELSENVFCSKKISFNKDNTKKKQAQPKVCGKVCPHTFGIQTCLARSSFNSSFIVVLSRSELSLV